MMTNFASRVWNFFSCRGKRSRDSSDSSPLPASRRPSPLDSSVYDFAPELNFAAEESPAKRFRANGHTPEYTAPGRINFDSSPDMDPSRRNAFVRPTTHSGLSGRVRPTCAETTRSHAGSTSSYQPPADISPPSWKGSNGSVSSLSSDPARRQALFSAPPSRPTTHRGGWQCNINLGSRENLATRNVSSSYRCQPRPARQEPARPANAQALRPISKNNVASSTTSSCIKFEDCKKDMPRTAAELYRQQKGTVSYTSTNGPKARPKTSSVWRESILNRSNSSGSVECLGSALERQTLDCNGSVISDLRGRLRSAREEIRKNPADRKVLPKSPPPVIIIGDDDDDTPLFKQPKSPPLTPYLSPNMRRREDRDAELQTLASLPKIRIDEFLEDLSPVARQKYHSKEYQDDFMKRLELVVARIPKDQNVDFVPLNSDEQEAVSRAFASGPPESQILSSKFKIDIRRKDMSTLKGANWLNDEICNFFFEMIVDRYKNKHSDKKVHFFNTFFYTQLCTKGYSSVRRWTKNTDIFAHDIILIPIHLGNHWALAVIDIKKKQILYYDSLGNGPKALFETLRMYLEEEMKDKKKSTMEWDLWNFVVKDDIPQQNNGSDCGVFMLKFADYVSRDKRIDFGPGNMQYFRQRICWEILQQKLMGT